MSFNLRLRITKPSRSSSPQAPNRSGKMLANADSLMSDGPQDPNDNQNLIVSTADNFKVPRLTSQDFMTGSTSLVDYSRKIVIKNPNKVIQLRILIKWWKICVSNNVPSAALQQDLLDQIESRAFFDFCLDRRLIDATVAVDTSLPVFERRPSVRPGKQPIVNMWMPNDGGLYTVPYYGNASIRRLEYMQLLKDLPKVRDEQIMYSIFAGMVINVFHFETDERKRLVLARATSARARRYWHAIRSMETKHPNWSRKRRAKEALVMAEDSDTARLKPDYSSSRMDVDDGTSLSEGTPGHDQALAETRFEGSADAAVAVVREPPEPVALPDYMENDDEMQGVNIAQ
ncbi:MAG: hypothetical protein M1812_006161 [Candelaria pacifica]|nr:MAG: hypothetical protein M1812_006161 [Candelaria pacifica]